MLAYVGGQGGGVRPAARPFAGRVDIGDHHLVGVAEAAGKLVEQVGCTAEPVRLEESDQAAFGICGLCGRQSRTYLGRMMAVVVDDVCTVKVVTDNRSVSPCASQPPVNN